MAALQSIESSLRAMALVEARSLAQVYAQADETTLPGVRQFGEHMSALLANPPGRLDFEQAVARNPVFWQAERELSPMDVGLPYLVAMLAALAEDYGTAQRLLALNQATLPMTPMIRRIYCRPEAMMITREALLLQGVAKVTDDLSAEQVGRQIGILGTRIARWPNQLGLARRLLELEVKRVTRSRSGGAADSAPQLTIGESLKLTASDRTFAERSDPIWHSAMAATVADWVAKRTLAQRWIRWIEYGDPAESAEVEQSISVFEASDRPDLAWMTWRAGRSLELFVDEPERWHGWARKLLGDQHAARLAEAIEGNPSAGSASLPVPADGFGEAWSGDQNIHPLLAIKVERQLALMDAMLLTAEPGSIYKANLHVRRLNLLCMIYALEGAEREAKAIAAIMGAKAMAPIQENLARTRGDFDQAAAIYRDTILQDPRNESGRRNYAAILYMAGRYREARTEYLKAAVSRPDDAYIAIMADLAARRAGERELGLLQAALAHHPADTWLGQGLRHALGELTAGQLLTEAARGSRFDAVQHECEASFWIAQGHLAAGDRAEGIRWLERCLATGLTSFVEYQAAKAELKRLVPDSDAPPNRDSERSSPYVAPA